MTDISVSKTAYQVEKRSWLIPQSGAIGHGYTPSGTLDVSAFTPAIHYPNGYIPSGIVLGRITATGLLAPYDNAFDADPVTAGQQGDGRETAVGLLYASIKIPNLADTTKDVGCAFVAAFAVVRVARLPLTTGAGSLDTAARADLPTIYFES